MILLCFLCDITYAVYVFQKGIKCNSEDDCFSTFFIYPFFTLLRHSTFDIRHSTFYHLPKYLSTNSFSSSPRKSLATIFPASSTKNALGMAVTP